MDVNERLWAEYTSARGWAWEFEPQLATQKLPDFRITRGALEAVVEVEGFDAARPDPRPTGKTTYWVSPGDEFRPLRNAIRAGARQLGGFAGRDVPLIVALANANGSPVELSSDALYYALIGDPLFRIPVNVGGADAPAGDVSEGFFDPRNGKIRDHAYLSAVAIVYPSPTHQDKALESGALAEWAELVRRERSGEVLGPCVDAYCFDRPQAAPVPPSLFSGRFDRIWRCDAEGVRPQAQDRA